MPKKKHHPNFYSAFLLARGCPICGNHPKNNLNIIAGRCQIFRTSKTSVTMKCPTCGLKFTFTFKAMAEALLEKARKMEEPNGIPYVVSAKWLIESGTDATGTHRNDKWTGKELETVKFWEK